MNLVGTNPYMRPGNAGKQRTVNITFVLEAHNEDPGGESPS